VSTPSTLEPLRAADQTSVPALSQTLSLSNGSVSKWFDEEVHPHDAQLKAYLRNAFPSLRDVNDITQESYLRVWKARAAHPIESAKAFLFTVARRLAIKTARKNRDAPVEFVGDFSALRLMDDRRNPAEAFSYKEKVELLAEALALLPARCREIVILRKLRCLPQKEVADQLGLSERTVENQLARGIRRCEAFFDEPGVRTLL
jgi:RNA polymerase sigma factor (sigma-70 family)